MDVAAALVVMLSAMAVTISCHQVCFIGSEYNPHSGMPPRWFLPCEDPCECTAIRLGGMRIPASSYRQGAPHYLNELFLSEDSDEIQDYFDCQPAENNPAERSSPQPLGMEDGTIQDERITASSSYYCCSASEARLNHDNGWIAESDDANPWIEVDLVEPTVVSGVITQGYRDTLYVKKYMVAYKKQPSSDYEHVNGNGDIKVFIGYVEGNTLVTSLFDESVVATVVRIEPTEWNVGVALRLELLGCRRD